MLVPKSGISAMPCGGSARNLRGRPRAARARVQPAELPTPQALPTHDTVAGSLIPALRRVRARGPHLLSARLGCRIFVHIIPFSWRAGCICALPEGEKVALDSPRSPLVGSDPALVRRLRVPVRPVHGPGAGRRLQRQVRALRVRPCAGGGLPAGPRLRHRRPPLQLG